MDVRNQLELLRAESRACIIQKKKADYNKIEQLLDKKIVDSDNKLGCVFSKSLDIILNRKQKEKFYDKHGQVEIGFVNMDGAKVAVYKHYDSDTKELTHEACVGICAINKLLDCCPGFVQSYYYRHSNAFLFLEYVKGIPLESYIKAHTLDEPMINLLCMQVFSALYLAYTRFDFTHYDLHLGNVMICRDPSKLVEIPIYHPDGVSFVKTDFIVKIIDFGLSYVKIDDMDIGAPGDFEYVNIKRRTYPMFDVNKFLLSFYANSPSDQNRRVIREMYKEIFNCTDVKFREELKSSSENFGCKMNDEYISMDYDKIMKYMIEVNRPILHNQPTLEQTWLAEPTVTWEDVAQLML